jgi:glutamate synthase domain-containing protein 3
MEFAVRNANRTIGAMLSGEVAKRHGAAGLPEDTIMVSFTGSAGQSFGAFLSPGISFRLEGESNDYLGKGLSGGRIVVVPPARASFRPEQNTIVGNTLLYGATGGSVYVSGTAGERFAVRNSGATAVVEGVGDHGCEYMTGGLVIVLGATGRNFAAGMSGGIAFVLDQSQLFDTLCNLDMVDLEPVADPADVRLLHGEIENHARLTGSRYAAELLETWEEILPRFVKVMPIDYRKALEAQRREESHDSFAVPVTEEVFPRHA